MTTPVENNRVQWMMDARFGVLFPWGIYAVHGRGEWAFACERATVTEREKFAYRFKPKQGWADEWMDLVTKSGARYAVLTTKHHDGYCLFPTSTTTFSAPETGL